MSQTNTNINNGQNRNQISGRGGQGQEGINGSGRSDCCNGHGNNSIATYSFEGKMEDGPISKLTITKTGHRPSQFKKISDTLPALCADKKFWGLDEVLWTWHDLVKTDFMPPYPNANLGERPVCYQKWWNRHTSLTQISRRRYYRDTNRFPRTSLKSTSSSLQTRRL